MTRFHLVRHGEKSVRTEILSGRAPGVHLSARGQGHAAWVANALADAAISRIFSSPRERARETAAPLAARIGVGVEVADALDEMDLGHWTGMHPGMLGGVREFERFNRVRALTRVPGGETMLEVQARVVGALLRWRDAQVGGAIALFSHAEPIRAALLFFTGAPLDQWSRWEVALGSITTVELDADGARVVRTGWQEAP